MSRLLWFFSMFLLVTQARADVLRAPCNPAQLRQVCQKLAELGATDSLALSDGRQLPSCLLSTPRSYREFDYVRPRKARLLQLLRGHPSVIHPSRVDEFYSKYLDVLTSSPQSSYYGSWPLSRPTSSEGVRTFSPSEIRGQLAAIPVGQLAAITSLAREISTFRQQLQLSDVFVQTDRQETNRFQERLKSQIQRELLAIMGTALSPNQLSRRRERAEALELLEGTQAPQVSHACAPDSGTRNRGGSLVIDHRLQYFPTETNYLVMAHELAHPHNYCREHLPVYRRAPSAAGHLPLYAMPASGSMPTDLAAFYRTHVPAGELARYPFRDIYRCQSRADRGGFAPLGAGSCARAEHDESFADYLAARTLGAMLERNRSFQQAPRPTISRATSARHQLDPSLNMLIFYVDTACAVNDDGGAQSQGEFYPAAARRYFDILLREPAIARSANCPVTGPRCEFEERPATTSGGSAAGATAH